jgi:hypothetical protein
MEFEAKYLVLQQKPMTKEELFDNVEVALQLVT